MSYNGLKLDDIDSEIVGILNCLIAENGIKIYVEPYIGFGDIIGNIQCESKCGYDSNKYIIELMNYLSNSGSIPDNINLGAFEDAKAHYQCKSKAYENWYYGLLGFMLSGSDETKPFNSRYITQDALNDAYSKTRDNIENHRSYIDNTKFTIGKIEDICDDLKDALIYCKIPKYKRFKADKFLEKMLKLSENNIVILKTDATYNEFELIWEEYSDIKQLGRQLTKLYRIVNKN